MKHHDDKKGPSQRQLRVGELIRHAMTEILSRGELQNPLIAGAFITIPEVRMSPDLRLATIYIMPLGGKDEQEVLAALDRHKKHIRTELARRINLRYAPDLRFRRDETFDDAGRIERLLQSEKVQADLARPQDPDDDET